MIRNSKLSLCFLFDRVTTLLIVKDLLSLFKSSPPYMERQKRVINTRASTCESWISLIIDFGMLLDMVNIVEKTFELPLLQEELFVTS